MMPTRGTAGALRPRPPTRPATAACRIVLERSCVFTPGDGVEQLAAGQNSVHSNCGMVHADNEIAVDACRTELLERAVVADGVGALSPDPGHEVVDAGGRW